MKEFSIVATHEVTGEKKVFEFKHIVWAMGHQCAEEVSLEEEVGKELAWLHDEFENLSFAIRS